jgi:hypothetical protein
MSKLNRKEKVYQQFADNGGELNKTNFKDYEELFGEEFPVAVKFHNHESDRMSIKEFKQMETDNPELYADVRHVFMPSDVYDTLYSVESSVIEWIKNNL